MEDIPPWPVEFKCGAAVGVKLYKGNVIKAGPFQADCLSSGSGADF